MAVNYTTRPSLGRSECIYVLEAVRPNAGEQLTDWYPSTQWLLACAVRVRSAIGDEVFTVTAPPHVLPFAEV